MLEYEFYNWNKLISDDSRKRMVTDIDKMIDNGQYWKNSPPYQTDVNVFGIPTTDWINLKMSFIWSAFAYMQQERQIKTVKSWAYKTNLDTQENRDIYWHQHTRENNLVLSGVYYLQMPEGTNLSMSGTEFAPNGVEAGNYIQESAKVGEWIIFPGKTWHRPGVLESNDWRYIVAADMEI